MEYIRAYRISLLIFCVALVLRIFFLPFSLFDTTPFGAEQAGQVAFDGYWELAENIRAGNGFTRSSEPPYVPDSVRTPLYPYLIAGLAELFGGSYKPLFLLQALLGAGAAVLSWLLARRLLDTKAALAVGILVSIEPLTAYLPSTILTESVFIFLFFIGILRLLCFFETQKTATLITAAAVLGIATLVKPTVQYMPLIVLIPLLFIHGRNWKPLLLQFGIFTAVFLLTLSPWIYRNYTTFGTTELVVQSVSNLYAYLVPSTIAFEKNISYEQAAAGFFAQEQVQSIEDVNLGNMDEFRERAVTELKQHPKGLLMSTGMTLFTFFTHDTYATILDRYGVAISFARPPFSVLVGNPAEAFRFAVELMQKPEGLVLFARLMWICIALLSAIGVALYAVQRGISPKLLLVTGLVAYFAVTTIVIGLSVNGRFRVPVNPIIFIFAVYTLHTILHKRPDGDETIA